MNCRFMECYLRHIKKPNNTKSNKAEGEDNTHHCHLVKGIGAAQLAKRSLTKRNEDCLKDLPHVENGRMAMRILQRMGYA